MLKVLICEDDQNDRIYLTQLLETYFYSRKIENKIYYLNKYQSNDHLLEYDLIFLDIELGETNGIEFAKRIRSVNTFSIIIITSCYKKYLVEGYKIDAKRFFIKPIQKNVFELEMDSVLLNSKNQLKGFYDTKVSPKKILFKDILYIEFLDRKTHLHLINGNILTTRYPLKHWNELVDDFDFSQPYKCFLVNLSYVSGFSHDNKDVLLINNEKIPLSKHYKKAFMEKYFMNLHTVL